MSCEDCKTDQLKNYQENRTEQLSANNLTLTDIPVPNVHRGKSNNAFLLIKVENCISRTGRVQAEPVSLLLPPCCRALYCEFSGITIMRPLVLLHIIILCAPGQQCNNNANSATNSANSATNSRVCVLLYNNHESFQERYSYLNNKELYSCL